MRGRGLVEASGGQAGPGPGPGSAAGVAGSVGRAPLLTQARHPPVLAPVLLRAPSYALGQGTRVGLPGAPARMPGSPGKEQIVLGLRVSRFRRAKRPSSENEVSKQTFAKKSTILVNNHGMSPDLVSKGEHRDRNA